MYTAGCSMKRDATGKFVSHWGLETKRRVSITLTDTAWQLLEEEAQKYGISRSELIERVARGFSSFTYTQQLILEQQRAIAILIKLD